MTELAKNAIDWGGGKMTPYETAEVVSLLYRRFGRPPAAWHRSGELPRWRCGQWWVIVDNAAAGAVTARIKNASNDYVVASAWGATIPQAIENAVRAFPRWL